MSRRRVGLLVALMVVALLVGCGEDKGNSTSPTVAPATPTLEPTPTSTPVEVTLGEVVWSTSIDDTTGAPGEPLTTLSNTTPRVYAAVHTDLLPAGTEVQARWTIDGDPLPQLDPEPVVVDADRADAWISWSLTWTAEQPWPIGALGIVIDVDGEIKAQSEILITRDHADDDG